MDQGLFKKHILHLQKVSDEKEEVILYIQEKTGVLLKSEEIIISKKIINFQTSSVKRSQLLQKNLKEVLQEKGYTLKI